MTRRIGFRLGLFQFAPRGVPENLQYAIEVLIADQDLTFDEHIVEPAIRGGDGYNFPFLRPVGTFSAGRVLKGRLDVLDLIGNSGLEPISPFTCLGHTAPP